MGSPKDRLGAEYGSGAGLSMSLFEPKGLGGLGESGDLNHILPLLNPLPGTSYDSNGYSYAR